MPVSPLVKMVVRPVRPPLIGEAFLYFDDVDHAGHDHVWHSPIYYDAVAKIDALVGNVLDAVDLRKTKSPGWPPDPPSRGKGELKQPIYSLETAPTAAAILGIRAHACWTGRDIFR